MLNLFISYKQMLNVTVSCNYDIKFTIKYLAAVENFTDTGSSVIWVNKETIFF